MELYALTDNTRLESYIKRPWSLRNGGIFRFH